MLLLIDVLLLHLFTVHVVLFDWISTNKSALVDIAYCFSRRSWIIMMCCCWRVEILHGVIHLAADWVTWSQLVIRFQKLLLDQICLSACSRDVFSGKHSHQIREVELLLLIF